MNLKELIKEHARLIKVLESKDKEDDKSELGIQTKELKKYLKQLKQPKKK
jgi:hypothetical protein